jgi:hypothetical protein
MRNNNEIEVIEATPDLVEIKVGSICCRFCRIDKQIRMVSKYDPFREIYDARALWIPKKTFRLVCQRAAATMRDHQKLATKKRA